MSDNYPFTVGQKVKCISLAPEYGLHVDCLNRIGIIIRVGTDYYGSYTNRFTVQFTDMISDRGTWHFLPPHIVPASDEEMALFQEHKRRIEYADKYL